MADDLLPERQLTPAAAARVPTLGVAAVVLDESDRVLLIQRGKEPAKGLWSFPGGRVEFGETLGRAVQREVNEECSVNIELGAQVEWVERIADDHHFVIVDFLATLNPPQQTPRAASDAADIGWFTRQEVDSLPTTAGLARVLDRALALPRHPR